MNQKKENIGNWMVILLTCFLLFTVIGLSYRQYIENKKKVMDQFRDYQSLVLHQLSSNLETFFQTRSQGLKQLSTYPSFTGENENQILTDLLSFFRVINQFNILSITLVNAQGQLQQSTDSSQTLKAFGDIVGLDPYFKELNQPDIFVYFLPGSPSTGAGILSASVFLVSPVWAESTLEASGTLSGFLLYEIDFEELVNQTISSIVDTKRDLNICILAKDKTPLFMSHHSMPLNRETEAGNCMLCHFGHGPWESTSDFYSGSIEFQMPEHDARILYFDTMTVNNAQWTVSISVEKIEIMGFISKSYAGTLTFIGLIVSIMFLSTTVVYRKHRLTNEAIQEADHLKEKDALWERIREKQVYLRSILNNSHDLICTLRKDGGFGFINSHWEKMTGYEHDSLVKQKFMDLVPAEKRDDLNRILSSLDSSQGQVFETELVRLDGAFLPVFASVSKIEEYDEWILILRDITDLLKTQHELEVSRDVAQKANRAKSEFLANMSHEIRTPMNAIMGISELVLQTELTPFQKKYLCTMKNSADQLLAIINDILDFSKIEAGMLEIVDLPFHLRETLENVCDTLAYKAEEKGLELALFLEPKMPEFLIGDEGRIRQVLVNIINNAVKFTKEGFISITVTSTEQGSSQVLIRVDVSDTGIGIAENKLSDIFGSFRQADDSISRNYGGTGLGLAISKQLVNKMRGKLWVESEEGKGSVFSFEIPLPIYKESLVLPLTFDHLKGLSILVVDDLETNRHVLKSMLSHLGCHITEAENATQAMSILEKQPHFDAMITDHQMPGLSGIDLILYTREMEAFKHLPAVLLSSIGHEQTLEKRPEYKNIKTLTKPLKQLQLMHALSQVLGIKSGEEPMIPESMDPTEQLIKRIRIKNPSARILLAEDNQVNQMVTKAILKKIHIIPEIANNGFEVIEAMKRTTFDLVLMDVQMPGMDGLKATQLIRTQLNQTTIPIIAMTARAMKNDRNNCLASGMNDFIGKPFNQAEFLAVLERWIPGTKPVSQEDGG